mgnify:CR=1 FL=1|jgi:hypothetical protein
MAIGNNPMYGSNTYDNIIKEIANQDTDIKALDVPQAGIADHAAPTAYSAATMANPVAKAEGEAMSLALATLRDEVATLVTKVSAIISALEDAGVLVNSD